MFIRNFRIFMLFCPLLQAPGLTLLYDFPDATRANSLHYLGFPARQDNSHRTKFSLSCHQVTIF
jgi:hypothetical protein